MQPLPHVSVDTSEIKDWRSIITLVVFVLTNIIVLFPFHIPIYVPRPVSNFVIDTLSKWRIISSRNDPPPISRPASRRVSVVSAYANTDSPSRFVVLRFPMNFVTTPVIADLFLLAILAIGRKEVHDGIVGTDHIAPYDIMIFFLTLAYIAISVDASGLIRYLAFKVLQWGGSVGHRLFFYLYAFFFALGSCIGNDPIILSGTAFLAYMTRVSSNIVHPRAWIHTQFAVANIASAILVSSNPTNLVLAGAFKIKFVVYTANMIVPVVVTVIVLFPFLLYIVFANESLIPLSIEMHQLSEEAKARKPVNPNIPHARGTAAEEEENAASNDQSKLLSLEEIMNPFLDKGGAFFGAFIMAATLITLLIINAVSTGTHEHPVFWVTLPGAFVMFCWDLGFGWIHRHETREIARKGRAEVERFRAERWIREEQEARLGLGTEMQGALASSHAADRKLEAISSPPPPALVVSETGGLRTLVPSPDPQAESSDSTVDPLAEDLKHDPSNKNGQVEDVELKELHHSDTAPPAPDGVVGERISTNDLSAAMQKRDEQIRREVEEALRQEYSSKKTLVSVVREAYRWCQETFPTVTAVVIHLPFPLVPFAFAMFILVQALVSKGWVQIFALGWTHWVAKTGTIGAVGGMGFLAVVLCNFAGTNIGTTILLSRVIQEWENIHTQAHSPISQRTFWATVYSMALGVNYGAFSTAFSASLAGLLWRDILARKHIHVKGLDFARVNLPIIAIAMSVGCAILIGEVYLTRSTADYIQS